MSYIWFNAVLETTGKVLNYEAISNLYGKTVFDKKGSQEIQKIISEANPFYKKGGPGNAASVLSSMAGKMTIVRGTQEAQKAQMEKQMGDISWFEEFT